MKAQITPPRPPNPRKEAARILQRVLQDDAYANRLLDVSLTTHKWDHRDAGLLTELVYGVLRRLNKLDAIIDQLASKGIKSIDPTVLHHLRIAVYQLVYLDRIPAHAVLSEAVSAIRKKRGKPVAGFANALLRKYQRSPETFLDTSTKDSVQVLAQETSHPAWLVERYIERYGERAEERLERNNLQAPLTLRVNRSWGSRERMLERLEAEELDVKPTSFSPDGVHVQPGQSSKLHKLMKQNPTAWSFQDEAAQLLGHWLQPQPGEQILDACAAPGGKTTHLAALAPEASITAFDIHEHKVSLIQQACRRLQLGNVDVQQMDATQPIEQQFDRILCDAPCSGLGILRRQPEIRYRRMPKDLQRLQALQLQLLKNLAKSLKPGGLLLFSVCSDTREENQQVVDLFLSEQTDFQIVPPSAEGIEWDNFIDEMGYFRAGEHEMDGFFAVGLQKDK